MKVSKERLSIIGKMIGIYREEKRANSQNCWTQKRFCQDICSPNTLKSVEKGGLARSIEVYEELLDKFDLKIGEFPAIDEAVVKLTKKLYIALDYYRIDEALDILNKILRILDKVSIYIYYSELKTLFESVKEYYAEELLIDTEDVERFKQMLHAMPKIFADLFRFLVYAKIKAISITSIELYQKQVEDIALPNCKASFVKLGLIDYYYIINRYMKAKELISELEESFIKTDNIIRLFDIYDYAIVLFSRVEFEKCMELVGKAEELLNKHRIPNLKIGEFYSNTARALHINGNYDLALKYYNKMTEIAYLDFIDSYIFMADSQNRLDKKVEIPLVKEEQYNNFPNDVKLMYKYFTFDENYPDFTKENFIIKKIAPCLTDEEYIDVFRFELLRLVNHTNHYKRIHSFESKVKENLLSK